MSCDCNRTGAVPHRNVNVNRCGGPCGVTTTNTATCESLPSQIQNFTTQFFGEVTKTEVDGAVVWSLPCSLDTGLPNNPRAVGEGLACYFLRLFGDGIIGLIGPEGGKGDAGTNGHNAYTVTLSSFTQPTGSAPNVQILTNYNPAFLVGEYVFIATSGWYIVNATDTTGALFLTLVRALSGASGTITAGKLVVPAGFPGTQGDAGQSIQGPKGDDGPAGNTTTLNNGEYFAPVGTDYKLQIAYAGVTFVNSSPSVLLSAQGKYLVTVVADIVGLATVALSDNAFLKLFNTTTNQDASREHKLSHLVDTQRGQITLTTVLTTTGLNQTVQLYGKATTADAISVVALNTVITYVQIA